MKLAFIGTGFIIGQALECVEQIPTIQKSAIYARKHSLEKAEKFAQQYQIDEIYTDYDQLLKESNCDTVYIGLVNKAHYEYGMKALKANKNVIMEKPFCTNAKETKALIDLAEEKQLYVFEAVRPLHTPNYNQLKEDIKEIGNIRCIQCNYSQYSSRYNAYKEKKVLPALDPKLFGGALYDINIYNVNFVVSLFGLPKEVSYKANIGFNGVDTSGTLFLQYEDFYAICTGAKDSDSPGYAIIQGDEGYLSINDGANLIGSYQKVIHKEEKHVALNQYDNWMMHEFKDFEKMLNEKDYKRMKEYLVTSYQVMQVIDQAIASIPYGEINNK